MQSHSTNYGHHMDGPDAARIAAEFRETALPANELAPSQSQASALKKHGLQVHGAVVPHTIAAVLLQLRDHTGQVPHAYFNWTEGHPIGHLLRFLVFGDGEVAPVTREVLRRAESRLALRPRIHVG